MKYRVADYVIDTALYRVSRGGVAIPVEPKVFDLLVCLIRHRDRVLSRDELFQKVWDGREVSDATLSNHVKSARKILGDSGELQQTILTIRGRGYQFVAPVVEVADDATNPDTANPPVLPTATATAGKAVASRWLPLVVAIAAICVAVLLGWRYFDRSDVRSAVEAPYLVVVPFDVSSDAPDTWRPFADQVTREMIRNLRKISGLRVVPASSAFAFKDNKTRDHIRRQLPDVRYVLDGAVSISGGNALRITAELEDLNKGAAGLGQELRRPHR